MLDTGETFRAHSQLLVLSSCTIAEAAGKGPTPAHLQLSFPGVSTNQVLLLLCALYAMPKTAEWAGKLALAELQALAEVCHAQSCEHLLEIADGALANQADEFIDSWSALDLYRQARELGLAGFQQSCAKAIVTDLHAGTHWGLRSNLHEDGLCPILLEVAAQLALPASLDSDLLKMVQKLKGLKRVPCESGMSMELAEEMLKA